MSALHNAKTAMNDFPGDGKYTWNEPQDLSNEAAIMVSLTIKSTPPYQLCSIISYAQVIDAQVIDDEVYHLVSRALDKLNELNKEGN